MTIVVKNPEPYEYRVERRPSDMNPHRNNNFLHGPELAQWMNDLGAAGWELCAVVEDEYGASEFMFKRRKKQVIA